MANLVATALIVIDVVLGAAGFSWLLVLPLGLVGLLVYFWVRPLAYETVFGRGEGGVGAWAIMYATQAATAALFFGLGRLIGLAF